MDTDQAYALRFSQLRARYERARFLKEAGHWDWSTFVDWVIALRLTLRAASFRQYRAAVTWALRQTGDPEIQSLAERLRHIEPAAPRGELPRRTSACKSKSLSRDDQCRLMCALHTRGGRWDELAGDWLFWSMETGLRPVEWREACLRAHATGVALNVRNAKHSHGRAHGENRTVHLAIDEELRLSLQRFIVIVQRDFGAAYQGCRLAIRRATRALWPRRASYPSLYTGRHQFSANAKASGLLPEELAALMGHAVIETAQEHYGKRRSGRGGGLVAAADRRDVQRVRERMQAKVNAARANDPSAPTL